MLRWFVCRENDEGLALALALVLNGALSTPIIRTLSFYPSITIYIMFHAVDI